VTATATPAGVFDLLERPLAELPDAEALVCRRGRFSYAELDNLADRAAAALYAQGLRPGDRVAVSLPNDVDIVAAFHGAMRLGAVWVGINRILAPPEKSFMIKDSGASLVIVDDAEQLETDARLLTLSQWIDAVESASSGTPPGPRPDPTASAAIAYTSGTTGFPKGAVHSQAGLILPGAATVARRGWGPALRKGDSLPLTILNMQVLTTLLTAQAGGTAVIIDQTDVKAIIDWIRRERVTVWNGPPAQLFTMITDDTIQPADVSGLDEVWAGGGDCSDDLRARFEAKYEVPVSRTYGLTEAPALVSIDDRTGERPPGTSGRPLDHIEVTTEDGEFVLGPTHQGPWAGRYRPMLEYWGHADATAEVLAGGALRTGDLGAIGPVGHLRVDGRRSQLIIRGGANVYPAEVERILATAPGVKACAVVGVPDERLGERVGAVVEVGSDGAEEEAIVAYCRQSLAAYKVPERLAFVERLPRNAMGKVPAPALRELLSVEGRRVGSC
jgi:acyl-CoA synthetase (AMP-forming)/AMP-acid ligase II